MSLQWMRAVRIGAVAVVVGVLGGCGGGGGGGGDKDGGTAAATAPAASLENAPSPGAPAGAATAGLDSAASTVPGSRPAGVAGPAPGVAPNEPTVPESAPAADGVVGTFAVTPQAGGSGTLEGSGSVSIGPGALESAAAVELRKTASPWVAHVFTETASLFRAHVRAAHEMRITLGATQPVDAVTVDLSIPAELRARAGAADEVRVMAINIDLWEGDRLETAELVGPRARPSDARIQARLDPVFFQRNAEGRFEASVFLALTPTAPTLMQSARRVLDTLLGAIDPIGCAHADDGPCKGVSILRPVDDRFVITSKFGKREAPVAGASTFHRGVDFGTPAGTPVRAAAGGILETARWQRDRAGKVTGWGYYAVLRHDDGGATLYAHLTGESVKVPHGTRVAAGDVIALSGGTGIGNAPHLHFEYAPSGKIFVPDMKVNPAPCMQRVAAGKIVLRDDGYSADDAFSLMIDGMPLCSTTIGSANSCTLGELRPGRYRLTLTIDVAPDGFGTHEIVSHDPKILLGPGAQRVSGSQPQGSRIDYLLNVKP